MIDVSVFAAAAVAPVDHSVVVEGFYPADEIISPAIFVVSQTPYHFLNFCGKIFEQNEHLLPDESGDEFLGCYLGQKIEELEELIDVHVVPTDEVAHEEGIEGEIFVFDGDGAKFDAFEVVAVLSFKSHARTRLLQSINRPSNLSAKEGNGILNKYHF
jgi:hypothetical protein